MTSAMTDEFDLPDDLPQLTDEDKAALDQFPDNAVFHWWNGEKWDFDLKVWIPSVDTSP